MPMMYYYGWSWGGALFMVLSSLFWLGVLGLLLWAAIRWASAFTRTSNAPSEPSAREILARRYARGEIDIATYEDMLAHLQDRAPELSAR
jgi:putative membrane protein